MAVSRELLYAKLGAQICSTCFSAYVGLHHVLYILDARRRAGHYQQQQQQRTTTAIISNTRPTSLSNHVPPRRRDTADTTGTHSNSTASDLASSQRQRQREQGHTTHTTLTTNDRNTAVLGRRDHDSRPKAAASTRILRAACFSDLAFSLTGAIVTAMQLFSPASTSNFQLIFWVQAPHWCGQIASFLWMATLGLYIAKKANRASFDVAIAHAVIWLIVVFYWVLELYAMYYSNNAFVQTAKIIWKVMAVSCLLVIAVSWATFANRWRSQTRRNGALVLSKILSYAIAFFLFVSPNVVVDLAQGLDKPSNDNLVVTSIVLALWPTANALIYLTKQTLCLRFFQKHQEHAADDVYSLQASRRLGGAGGGGGAGGLGQQMLMSPTSNELKGLVVGEKIGEGIAVVYSGKWRGANVAVKMKSLMIDSTEQLEEFQHACNLEIQEEAEVMKGLCHPNIVLFMEAGFYKGSICIISEYCARGSLRDVLMRSNVKHLSWPTKLRLALGICHGIQYLHNAHPPMIHRDLKSPNVLVDDSWHAKIADFGTLRFSEIVSSVQNTSRMKKEVMDMTGLVGTTRWMAPEVMRGEKSYTSKVDIYSLALILWELIEGKLPFESTRWNHEIEDFVLQERRPMIKDELCPPRWKLLIVTCWQPDPKERPTIQQVINNLQRIAREEVWDTTGPRFTGVSSQFSVTQSSISQSSFVSSTVSASYMDSPPSILGGSVLRGSSISSGSSYLGATKVQRKTQWQRLSDTIEEQQFSSSPSNSSSSSMDEYSSSITIIEQPSPDEGSFLGTRLQQQQQQCKKPNWQRLTDLQQPEERRPQLSMSDLEMGSSVLSREDLSTMTIVESSPNGSFTVTI